jgi:hypothetical protein
MAAPPTASDVFAIDFKPRRATGPRAALPRSWGGSKFAIDFKLHVARKGVCSIRGLDVQAKTYVIQNETFSRQD